MGPRLKLIPVLSPGFFGGLGGQNNSTFSSSAASTASIVVYHHRQMLLNFQTRPLFHLIAHRLGLLVIHPFIGYVQAHDGPAPGIHRRLHIEGRPIAPSGIFIVRASGSVGAGPRLLALGLLLSLMYLPDSS